jgi:hypothetical protein
VHFLHRLFSTHNSFLYSFSVSPSKESKMALHFHSRSRLVVVLSFFTRAALFPSCWSFPSKDGGDHEYQEPQLTDVRSPCPAINVRSPSSCRCGVDGFALLLVFSLRFEARIELTHISCHLCACFLFLRLGCCQSWIYRPQREKH